MRKRYRMLAMILVAVCIIFGLNGCTSKSAKNEEVENALSEFEYACTNLDLDAILDCINPDVSDPIRLGLAVFSTFSGKDYEDFLDDSLDTIVSALIGQDLDPEDFLSTLAISNENISVNEDAATVECTLDFEIAGQQFQREATISMICKEEQWYVSGISIPLINK